MENNLPPTINLYDTPGYKIVSAWFAAQNMKPFAFQEELPAEIGQKQTRDQSPQYWTERPPLPKQGLRGYFSEVDQGPRSVALLQYCLGWWFPAKISFLIARHYTRPPFCSMSDRQSLRRRALLSLRPLLTNHFQSGMLYSENLVGLPLFLPPHLSVINNCLTEF